MTLRQEVSNIRNNAKLLSTDILINDRFIASELRNAANMIVGQQTDKRKLWQSPNVFTTLTCLEMEEVPLSECCDYTSNRTVAKSIIYLPQIGEGIFGLAINFVTGLDNQRKFIETTPMRFANLLKLNIVGNNVYYWILNNHVYISNPDTKAINFSAYFTEDIPNNLLYPSDCDCINKPSLDNLCKNPLDKDFKFPGNRINDIENIVLDRLSKIFLRRKEDSSSDNKED